MLQNYHMSVILVLQSKADFWLLWDIYFKIGIALIWNWYYLRSLAGMYWCEAGITAYPYQAGSTRMVLPPVIPIWAILQYPDQYPYQSSSLVATQHWLWPHILVMLVWFGMMKEFCKVTKVCWLLLFTLHLWTSLSSFFDPFSIKDYCTLSSQITLNEVPFSL
jgi:hypothetical protein